MSWGALPWWIYLVMHEHDLAMMSCAFEEEWFSGLSKYSAEHMNGISRSVFATYDAGGWNAHLLEESATRWDSLKPCYK